MDNKQFLSIKPKESICSAIGSELSAEFRKIMPDANIGCFGPGTYSQGNVVISISYNFESLRDYCGYCSIIVSIEQNIITYSFEYRETSNPKKGVFKYDLNDPRSIDQILTRFRDQAKDLYNISANIGN